MSQPGYHPICVLFQGNDCAFDGTYRLVCRHQVRQKEFNPGDNVEVQMGEDDDGDEEDRTSQDDDGVNFLNEPRGGTGRWRDAIALGDEMVMSLLRNMCKNQPTGKSPWGASSQKGKRGRDQDRKDEEQLTAKRVKLEPRTEECTTSQQRSDKVDSHQNDHLLQKILTAIQSIKESQDLVISEMHCIKQSQRQLSSQVDEIQRALENREKQEDVVSLDCDEDEDVIIESESEGSFVTPVSLYLSQPHQQRSSSLLSTSCIAGPSQPQHSPDAPAMPSSSDIQSQIIISNPTSHQPDLSTFPTQQDSSLRNDSTMPLYATPQQTESPFSFHQVQYTFRFTDNSKSKVYLGYHGSPLTLTKNEMEDTLFKTNTPAAFAYRLAGKVFTTEELRNSNTSGKSNKIGRKYQQLNVMYVNIILMEVTSRYPTCRNTKEGGKRLFLAINERCRNERKKLVYRSEKPNPVTYPQISGVDRTESAMNNSTVSSKVAL